jgi:hypothetical protein
MRKLLLTALLLIAGLAHSVPASAQSASVLHPSFTQADATKSGITATLDGLFTVPEHGNTCGPLTWHLVIGTQLWDNAGHLIATGPTTTGNNGVKPIYYSGNPFSGQAQSNYWVVFYGYAMGSDSCGSFFESTQENIQIP